MDHSKGFTLLEVCMAVALLALIAAIALPALSGYAERARTSTAVADIGTLSLDLYRWETNTGRFPNSLAEAGLDGRVDPWGSPYVYLNVAISNPGAVRKDKNLVPINTDFDLYSKGPDGRSVAPLTAARSRDDIVRANNGAFIGRADGY